MGRTARSGSSSSSSITRAFGSSWAGKNSIRSFSCTTISRTWPISPIRTPRFLIAYRILSWSTIWGLRRCVCVICPSPKLKKAKSTISLKMDSISRTSPGLKSNSPLCKRPSTWRMKTSKKISKESPPPSAPISASLNTTPKRTLKSTSRLWNNFTISQTSKASSPSISTTSSNKVLTSNSVSDRNLSATCATTSRKTTKETLNCWRLRLWSARWARNKRPWKMIRLCWPPSPFTVQNCLI